MAGFIVLENRNGLPDDLDFLMDILGFYTLTSPSIEKAAPIEQGCLRDILFGFTPPP
jgi:hypothetical protein